MSGKAVGVGSEVLERSRDLVLGISGASGARLGLRALALLAASEDLDRLHVVVSPRALLVAQGEVDPAIRDAAAYVAAAEVPADRRGRVVVHGDEALDAPISSGSFPVRGMAVVPCSAGTLAAVAHGVSRGLLQRAADVTLKERRRLVLALRESPYSLVHAENILAATRAGAIVAPPVPAFYAVRTLEEALDAFVCRVADLLDVRVPSADFRWKGAAR